MILTLCLSPGVVGVCQGVRQVCEGCYLVNVANHHGVQPRMGDPIPAQKIALLREANRAKRHL